MSAELSISRIIQIGDICQYLSLNSVSRNNMFNGSAIDERIGRMIYCEGKVVSLRYQLNPNDTTLRGVANYFYALLGRFAIQAETILNNQTLTPPVISGPANVSVNVGQNAVFTVSVISSLPYTLQWYDANGNAISGATGLNYILPNAQLSDSGKKFFAKATNVAGTVTSVTAVLVVSANIVGYYYYGDTDYASHLIANNDDVPYVGTFAINHGQPLSIQLPQAAANKYMVFKYPDTESVKTNYTNLPLNVGIIPSIAWNAVVTFGGWNYIFTRQGNTFGLNYVNPLIFS